MTKHTAGKAATSKTEIEERAFWRDRLLVLQSAIDLGKPGAIEDVKRKIAAFEGKIKALSARRELIPQSLQMALKELDAEVVAFNADIEARRKAARDGAAGRDRMAAAEIAGLTKRLADLKQMADHVKVPPRDQDVGMTPEALARPSRRDPILSLEEIEAITPDQARAARQIARIYEAITAAGQARIGRMDGAPGGGGGPDLPDEVALWHAERYLPWAAELAEHAPKTLDIVVKVAVMGIALDRIRRHHRVGYSAGLSLLRDGLDRYWKRI